MTDDMQNKSNIKETLYIFERQPDWLIGIFFYTYIPVKMLNNRPLKRWLIFLANWIQKGVIDVFFRV